VFCACDNYLTAEYQGSSQSSTQVATTIDAVPSRINSAVSGMYAKLGEPYGYFGSSSERADDGGYPAICLSNDLNSGDMTNPVSGYDWFSVAQEFSDRTPNYANPRLRSGLLYNIIYSTAEVITSVPDDTDNAELKAKRGQAKAIRAFAYLNLVPYFQFKYVGNEDKPTVPLMADEKTVLDPLNNPRATNKVIYDYIIADLTDAINDLEGYTRENKGVIDQQVAYGLRARAYLNMEKWAEAAADADSALTKGVAYEPFAISELTQPGFYDAADHNWMWAILIPQSLIGDALCAWPSQIGSLSGNGYTAYGGIYRAINKLLWDKIPATDVRKAWWLDEKSESPYLENLTWTDVAEGITYKGQEIPGASIADVKVPMYPYANVKFGQRSGVGSNYNDGDWCLMRAEEMILIKAEATAKAGKLAEGKSILENFVKTYRDPNFVSTASSDLDFANEVWLQRRIELWGEGFAMADKMRLGKNIVRFHPGEETNVAVEYQFNIAANDPWLLMRFTQTELNGNSGVVQNTGGVQPQKGDGAGLLDGVTD
jgi:hypothetical protein